MHKALPEYEQDSLHGSEPDLQFTVEERLQDWLQECLCYTTADTAKKVSQDKSKIIGSTLEPLNEDTFRTVLSRHPDSRVE